MGLKELTLRKSTLLPNVKKIIRVLSDIEENLRSDDCTFNLSHENVANNFKDVCDILIWALYEDGIGDSVKGKMARKRLSDEDIYLEPAAE